MNVYKIGNLLVDGRVRGGVRGCGQGGDGYREYLDVARNLASTVTAKTCQLGSQWFEVTNEGNCV
jgi:hypothetical protein